MDTITVTGIDGRTGLDRDFAVEVLCSRRGLGVTRTPSGVMGVTHLASGKLCCEVLSATHGRRVMAALLEGIRDDVPSDPHEAGRMLLPNLAHAASIQGRKGGKLVYWAGDPPTHCQLCGMPIGLVFVDGRVSGRTSWAIMCPMCHLMSGVGLGPGKGQAYRRTRNGRWVKREG